MRLPLLSLAVLSLGAAPVPVLVRTHLEDGVRLAERVPAPLAYLALATGDAQRQGFEALEKDPAARMVWSSFFDSRTSAALQQLRELATLSTGEVEFTLNALMPRNGGPSLPLLTCRVQLSDAGCAALLAALESGQLGGRSDDIAGRPTWIMRDDGAAQTVPAQSVPAQSVPAQTVPAQTVPAQTVPAQSVPAQSVPAEVGSGFRIALAGRDLLASNSNTALEEVLRGSAPGATSSVHPDSIAANAVFIAQRAQLGDTRGSHVLHVDWRRLRARVFDRIGEAPRIALQALGLAAADHVTVAMSSLGDATRTSVLIDQPLGPEGLLAVAVPTSSRKILANLAPLSLAGLTLAIDPARLKDLARPDARLAHGSGFVRDVMERCSICGVDFAEQVLPRLNGAGSAQLVLLDDDARDQGVAFSIGVRSPAAARSLLGDVREGFERRRGAAPQDRHRDHDDGHERDGRHFFAPDRLLRAEKELLTFAGPRGEASLGVVGSDLVFATRSDTIQRMSELTRRSSRERQRARQKTQEICDRIVALRAPSARNAVGVVEIDGSILGGDTQNQRTDAMQSGGRHAGLLFLDEGTLRVELVSPR